MLFQMPGDSGPLVKELPSLDRRVSFPFLLLAVSLNSPIGLCSIPFIVRSGLFLDSAQMCNLFCVLDSAEYAALLALAHVFPICLVNMHATAGCFIVVKAVLLWPFLN